MFSKWFRAVSSDLTNSSDWTRVWATKVSVLVLLVDICFEIRERLKHYFAISVAKDVQAFRSWMSSERYLPMFVFQKYQTPDRSSWPWTSTQMIPGCPQDVCSPKFPFWVDFSFLGNDHQSNVLEFATHLHTPSSSGSWNYHQPQKVLTTTCTLARYTIPQTRTSLCMT